MFILVYNRLDSTPHVEIILFLCRLNHKSYKEHLAVMLEHSILTGIRD